MADNFTSDDASNGTADGTAEIDYEIALLDWVPEDSLLDLKVVGEFSIHQSPKTSNATSPSGPSAKIMLVGNGGTAGDAKVEKATNPTELINTGDMQRLGGGTELSGGLAGKSVVARQEEHESDAASTSGMGGSPNGRGSASVHQGNFNKAPQTHSMGKSNKGYGRPSPSFHSAHHPTRVALNYAVPSGFPFFQVEDGTWYCNYCGKWRTVGNQIPLPEFVNDHINRCVSRLQVFQNNQGSMPFGAPTYFGSTYIHPSYHGFRRNQFIGQPRNVLRIDYDQASHHAQRPPTEQVVSTPTAEGPRDRQHLMDIPEEEVKTGKSGIISWPGGRRDEDQAEFIWKGQETLIKAAYQTKAYFKELSEKNIENIATHFIKRANCLGVENVHKYIEKTGKCRREASDREIFDYIKNRRLTKDKKRDQRFAFKTDTNKDIGKTAAKIKPINPPVAVGKAHKARTAPPNNTSDGFVTTDDERANLYIASIQKRLENQQLASSELKPMLESLGALPNLKKAPETRVGKYFHERLDAAIDRALSESSSSVPAKVVNNRGTRVRLQKLWLNLGPLASNNVSMDTNIRLSANELLFIFGDMHGLAFLQGNPDKETCCRFCRYLRQAIEATVVFFNGELKAYNILDFNVNKVPLIEENVWESDALSGAPLL